MTNPRPPVKPLIDFYGDDDPPSYVEEIVEPKSFRNRLISVLIWTTCLPFVLLLFFQQKNIETAGEVRDSLQLGLARESALFVESNLTNIKNQLTLALGTCESGREPEAARRALDKVLTRNPAVRRVSCRNADSQIRLPSDAAPEKESAPNILSLHIPAQSGENKDELGIFASIDIAELSRDFANLLYGSPYAGALFDRDHRLVYSTPFELPQHKAAAYPLTAAEITQIEGSHGTPFLMHTPGERVSSHIKAFVPIGSMGWTLVISESKLSRDEAMWDISYLPALGLIIAVVGTFVLASLLSIPITRSINALVDSVDKYGRTGRFERINKQLSLEGTTELVSLEATFARMAQEVDRTKRALQRSNARLEEKVRERTGALLVRNQELKTLQTLLTPLSAERPFSPENATLSLCVDRFRMLLDLSSLTFVPSGPDPAEGFGIDVRLGRTLYGRLILPEDAVLTVDKKRSLERLAYALAIVSANAKLVEHLHREQTALQTVFESMTDGVVIIGKSGRVRYANEYACRLLNNGESLSTVMFADLMTSEWESTGTRAIAEELGRREKTRIRSTRSADRSRVLELCPFTVSGMPGLPGERVGWILRDITREASLEAVKENIVGVVAHELKTPLTLLQLQARNLTRTIERGQTPSAEDVHEISEETLQLGQLVNDLLDVSSIRAGSMKLSPRVVHVESIVDRAQKLAAARYPMRVTRRIDLDAELFCVDPDRLTQVFVNLFNNAARYKKPDQSEALITVAARIDGQNIVIDVEDQGTGIAPDKVAHIFDQFFQADMSASRNHGGSGLGLTIVRGIVLAHGGTVAVTRSTPGRGTCLTLTLPLTAPPELL